MRAQGSASRVRPRFGSTARGLLWVSPWLVGSAAFLFVPMAMSLYYSLTDYPLLEPPLWSGLDNYRRMADDPVFLRVVKNTALFCVLSIPLQTILAIVLAVLLNGRIPLRRTIQACIFIPTLVPLIASAMVWMWLFNGELGLVNRVLSVLGVDGPAWLVDRDWVMPSMVLMSLWGVGQAMIVFLAALQDVPRQLYEAARIDGMGALRQFSSVTLPMISPAILFNVISLTIACVQVFAIPYVMFRKPDGTNPAGHFYTMYLYENAFVYGNMGYASAMAWVQLLVVLVLTGVMLLASRRLVHYRRV
ncbi:MAG: sugar ABC transporter permease [Phycisphaerales bacterium]|nr:sugar ABC transporter permease [Phycisphaerales bacterium]